MAHIPTIGKPQIHIHTYHTNVYVPCGPHITHMFIFHMLQTHAHTMLHTAHTCLTYATHTYIHICHTHTHINPTLSSGMHTALIPHIHTNGPRSYPQHTHLCTFPQFHTYYIHVDIHTASILITHTHKHIYFLGLPRWLSGKESTCQAADVGSIPGSGRSVGEGKGNSLQYFFT